MKRGRILLACAILLAGCAPPLSAPTATAGPAVAEPLVPNARPGSLLVDAQALYWSHCDAWESPHGTIQMRPTRPGAVQTLASEQACPLRLDADDDNLYWIDREGIAGGLHHIFRLPKKGGSPHVLTSDRSVFRTLLVGPSHLYWWTEEGAAMRLSKDGRGQPEALPFPAQYILAFDGADVYWQNANGDLIRSRDDGSRAVTLLPGSEFAPATAEGHRISSSIAGVYPTKSGLYFKVYTDGNPGMVSCSDQSTRLMKIARGGGKPVPVAQAPGFADSLFVGNFVYFAGDCTEGISKVSLENGERQMFIQSLSPVGSLRTDGEFIYWVTHEDWTIVRARQ